MAATFQMMHSFATNSKVAYVPCSYRIKRAVELLCQMKSGTYSVLCHRYCSLQSGGIEGKVHSCLAPHGENKARTR